MDQRRTSNARLHSPLNRRKAQDDITVFYQRLYPGTEGSRRWDEERKMLKDRSKTPSGRAIPTSEALKSLAAKAHTPADHLALQGYFEQLEQHYNADAAEHAAMAASYTGTPIAWAAVHCEQLASRAREAAQQAKGAALEQGRLASTGK